MRPYVWYDPAELIAEAEAYVREIEDRHHEEKRRMYEAMSTENYRIRRQFEELSKPFIEAKMREAPMPMFIPMSDKG